jgi:HPt (histidine-containing phosphotransfer) domain-containing protein
MSNLPLLDEEIVGTLREVMGEDFSLLIDTYIRDSCERIKALSQSIESGDADEVRRCAHSFKGSSSNIGAVRLADACRLLEAQALSGDHAFWLSRLSLIETEFAAVRQLLESSN